MFIVSKRQSGVVMHHYTVGVVALNMKAKQFNRYTATVASMNNNTKARKTTTKGCKKHIIAQKTKRAT